jgi:SagB-type dehydrogenase family enzyme
MDPRNQPRPFKRYPQARVHPLPADLPPRGAPAAEALSGRVPPDETAVDLELIARLLFFSAGVTRFAGAADRGIWFRAAPSAGNLHPLEVYVVTGAMAGLDAGLYHFAPDVFGVEELSPGDCRAAVADAVAAPEVAASPAVLVVTGIPWRTAWKYGERGWRHVYWDAGALIANLLVVAEAYRLRARVLLGFVDSALCRQLGIDGVAEFPVAVITIGRPDAPATTGRCEPGLEATPLSPAPIEFPLITRVQQAGNLATAEQVATWRTAAPSGLPTARETVDPPAVGGAEAVESVILRRGSTRRMRRGVVPAELLYWGMGVATRQVPADAIPAGASLLSHELAVHAVRDMEPGLYHWVDGAPRLYRAAPENTVRRLSQRLCLDQPLGGDSAYTEFSCADLERVLDGYGDRGYRVAQLEAGVSAGRLQLAAFTLDHGGTGLTFSDEEVSAAFGTPAACMLAVAIGIPAYEAKPGGAPGRPTQLAG